MMSWLVSSLLLYVNFALGEYGANRLFRLGADVCFLPQAPFLIVLKAIWEVGFFQLWVLYGKLKTRDLE
jgi:hypothetical protein